MRTAPELYELLYVSSIAPESEVNIVGQIAREARAKNARQGITGLLVFDGERFCQHLEGSSAPIKQLQAQE